MRRAVRTSHGSAVRQWMVLLAGLAALLAILPALAHAQAPADTVMLVWTAPGDDGQIGTATSYEIRMSQQPITNDTDWSNAWVIPGAPTPRPSGTRQSVVVRGLSRGTTYYFAIKTTDDNSNVSAMSNVLRWDWVYDTAPPGAPSGVTASREGNDARIQWSPNSEPDLSGYWVYRSLTQGGPFTRLNSTILTSNQYVDTTLPSGTPTAWYQVTASDITGNESARSATVTASSATTATAWRLDVGYPNPSSGGATVHLPLSAPASAGNASVQIQDAGGRVVWHRDLGSLASGPMVVDWNGTNDAGRDVAPGVYTAWLIAGRTRMSVKLVRVP